MDIHLVRKEPLEIHEHLKIFVPSKAWPQAGAVIPSVPPVLLEASEGMYPLDRPH